MKFLLKGGIIVTNQENKRADLLIEDQLVSKISPNIVVSDAKEINCEGKFIFPGIIDTHVHFRDPGLTHKADAHTESIAAVSGGVTTIFDMPNTKPPATTVSLIHEKQEIFKQKCFCNFGIFIGASKDNIEELKKADTDCTIPGIKIFMAESTGEMTLHEDIYLDAIFSQTKKIIAVHAEDELKRQERLAFFSEGKLQEAKGMGSDNSYLHAIIRNNEVTYLGTKRAIEYALKYHHKTHILHVSAREELPFIENGMKAGLVTAETAPHYLWFTRDDIKTRGNYLVMIPALKGKEDVAALWDALRSNNISQIATDHAPHLIEEKDQPYGKAPGGVPGIEFSLSLMLHAVSEGKLSYEQMVALMCENPAKNYKIKNKGFLLEGYDADIVIVDPGKELKIERNNIRSKCGWSPYEGKTLKGGLVEKTFVNGNLVFDSGNIISDMKGKNIEIEIYS